MAGKITALQHSITDYDIYVFVYGRRKEEYLLAGAVYGSSGRDYGVIHGSISWTGSAGSISNGRFVHETAMEELYKGLCMCYAMHWSICNLYVLFEVRK